MLRVLLLVNVIGLTWFRRDNFDLLAVAWVLVVVMAGWTAFTIWSYAVPGRRVPVVLALDLAVALAMLAATPWVKGESFNASLPGFWIAGALLAWAVHWWWVGGLVAAMLLSATDLLIRDELTQANYGNVFLLLLAGTVVGYMCGTLQRLAGERDRAERAAAAAAERARLARAVHDGVLQVLALVQRRGAEIGGQTAELGRLAGEQEASLRSLIRQQDTLAPPSAGSADLTAALEQLATRRPPVVHLSGPGRPVLLPPLVVDELTAAVAAALANVARHVGEDASAWLLLEDNGAAVVVSVRDEGPGIEPGRVEAAAADGRLGVVESIRGRLADLGGTAELHTGPGGTEWELSVPR